MGIQSLGLLKNATSGSTTGGTAMTLSSDGQEVKNGVHVADMGEDNFLVRTNITFRTRNPMRQSDGSYSKAKRYATIVVPKLLASGDYAFNLSRVETEIHPESTAAEALNIFLLTHQIMVDSDTLSFFSNGSLA